MEYTITSNAQGNPVVNLIGKINEDSEPSFNEILTQITNADKIFFNFSQLKSINSLGVRCWISFLRNIENKEVIYRECTNDIVMQINMIPSFLGQSKIESFYVNYICEKCDKEIKALINRAKISHDNLPEAPKCEASDCGMQTEELESEYFSFLKR